jgi:hypothetical protein
MILTYLLIGIGYSLAKVHKLFTIKKPFLPKIVASLVTVLTWPYCLYSNLLDAWCEKDNIDDYKNQP